MSKLQTAILLFAFIVVMTGCRNRCSPCGSNWFANNATIAPPPTFSLNIPSVARNTQPYYTPGGNNTLNPNGSAPTPAGGNGQSNWQPSENNGGQTGQPNGNS
ncbi:MAG: hypothetical protein AAF939_17990, partial [Planctomycetota bacterium]